MKIEIINKPMLCWDNNESKAREYHVLAKVTECTSDYKYKAICNKNTYPDNPEFAGWGRGGWVFKNAKPLPQSKPRTIQDGLVCGDMIAIGNSGGWRKILGICGDVIFISELNECNISTGHYTLNELINKGYKLYNEQPQEIVELTIQDISKGKGKGVDPKLIRIKE